MALGTDGFVDPVGGSAFDENKAAVGAEATTNGLHDRFDNALAQAQQALARPLPAGAKRLPRRLWKPATWRRPTLARWRLGAVLRELSELEQQVQARTSWGARHEAVSAFRARIAEAERQARGALRRAIWGLRLRLFWQEYRAVILTLVLIGALALVLWLAWDRLMEAFEQLRNPAPAPPTNGDATNGETEVPPAGGAPAPETTP